MSFPTPIPTFDRHRRGLSRRRGTHSGLSIVEVLTSIVVAMIGVFGVMVLIPFAVRQAQTGLDSDAAVTVARNAVSQMELMGMQFPRNWTAASADPAVPLTPEVLSLDPIGVTETVREPDGTANFPFGFRRLDLSETFGGSGLEIPAANFRDPSGAPFDLELARRMCRSGNDLVFAEADQEDFAAGPRQLFDVDSGGLALRRQSQGRISWSAIVVPFTTDPTADPIENWSYRMYILVYKNRQFTRFNSEDDPGGAMAIAEATVANPGPQSPLGRVEVSAEALGVNRDEWVLLINRDGSLKPGFQKQLAFCRVVNVAETSLTLDGPDFNVPDSTGGGPTTYIVHLKDVVGVYERTFTPEQESNWNLSN